MANLVAENAFKEISKITNKEIFPSLRTRSLTVFLVGAGKAKKENLRDILNDELRKRAYFNWIDVYYPELLFEELMKSGGVFNLLSLENLLAKSVHTVVIILESPGAIAELGAFANHPELKDKLIVLTDKKYKKAKSFISLGPIRYLEKTKSIIEYYDLEDFNKERIAALASRIRADIRKISEGVVLDTSVANPIAAQHFLLATIYITEPIDKEALSVMVKTVITEESREGVSKDQIEAILSSSLNILLYRREIILKEGNNYYLTLDGLRRLRQSFDLKLEKNIIIKNLDILRVKILNSTLKGKSYYKKSKERTKASQTG